MGLFSHASAGDAVRKPAVAGQFYTADPGALRSEVEKYIAGGGAQPASKIMISPHAGYVFSGPVAGKAYAALDKSIKTVILLGPPHRVPVQGLAAPSAAWFETPLGRVAVDRERIDKLIKSKIACIDDNAHAPEHSVEVQIPFLQVRLPSFKIVPLLAHDVDPQKAADVLLTIIDDNTAVIASSDFSHYMTQKEARKTDDASIKTILGCDAAGFLDACGETPVRIVMALAKKRGLAPKLLDARTSFETAPQHGSASQVVGYAAIVYLPAEKGRSAQPAQQKAQSSGLAPEVKDFLLKLARASLDASVKGEKPPAPQNIPEICKENRGCFVTLTIQGDLRGCIGYIEPIKPLYQAVIENARNAALEDPRFPSVTPAELKSIEVEVSVLTKPEPLEYKDPQDLLGKLVPGVDGIILQKGMSQSTYLPQVWDHFAGDRIKFLENLSLKAGMPADGWKTANVKRYRAEHFSE